MPAESTILLAFLFVIAAACGWAFARYLPPTEDENERVSADYFKGLNFLLNEKPDEALEIFLRMVEVDDETVETHFALGNLFRRRGEVDRAIRIHQNLIARPNLARIQKDQALFALGEDYLKAGLLDRAEKLFKQLADSDSHRIEALEKLCSIFEQEKDWGDSIEVRKRLKKNNVRDQDRIIAHYLCELADLAVSKKEFGDARRYLREARQVFKNNIRATLTRAEIARETGDLKLAVKLYTEVVEHDRAFMPEVLPRMYDCFKLSQDENGFEKVLENLIARDPACEPDIAYSVIMHGEINNKVSRKCIRDFLLHNPTSLELFDAFGLAAEDMLKRDSFVNHIGNALKHVAERRHRYGCQECGFSGVVLYWQCPSCKSWDTTRPVRKFRIES